MTTGGFGKVIEAASRFFDKIILVVPVKQKSEFQGYRINADNVEFVDLPFYETEIEFLLKRRSIKKIINQAVRDSEAVHGWLPGYECWWAYKAAKRFGKKMIVYCGGDWELATLDWQPSKFKFLNKFIASYNDKLTRKIADNVPTFFMGEQLYEKYRHRIYPTNNSTLLAEDISDFRPTCEGEVINLLSVGRLSKEKSFSTITSAVKELKRQGYNCKVTLVGEGPEFNELKTAGADLRGFVPMGKELTKIYDEADIFVFPSYENSVAKVVLEAMSRSLPVVCSNAGAFPNELSDGNYCLLIEPGSVFELVEAVKKLVDDKYLRWGLAANSLEVVCDYCIDDIMEYRLKTAGMM